MACGMDVGIPMRALGKGSGAPRAWIDGVVGIGAPHAAKAVAAVAAPTKPRIGAIGVSRGLSAFEGARQHAVAAAFKTRVQADAEIELGPRGGLLLAGQQQAAGQQGDIWNPLHGEFP